MTEITLPNLQFWWTWLPLYVMIVGVIVAIFLAALAEYRDKAFAFVTGFMISLVVSMVTLIITASTFGNIQNDAIREVLTASEEWTNFTWTDGDSDVTEFIAESQSGEFISGFVVERQGKIGYVLDK